MFLISPYTDTVLLLLIVYRQTDEYCLGNLLYVRYVVINSYIIIAFILLLKT